MLMIDRVGDHGGLVVLEHRQFRLVLAGRKDRLLDIGGTARMGEGGALGHVIDIRRLVEVGSIFDVMRLTHRRRLIKRCGLVECLVFGVDGSGVVHGGSDLWLDLLGLDDGAAGHQLAEDDGADLAHEGDEADGQHDESGLREGRIDRGCSDAHHAHVRQGRVGFDARRGFVVSEEIGFEQIALGLGLALQAIEGNSVLGGDRGFGLGAGQVGLQRGFEIGLDLRFGFESRGDALAFGANLAIQFDDLRVNGTDGRMAGQKRGGALGPLALQLRLFLAKLLDHYRCAHIADTLDGLATLDQAANEGGARQGGVLALLGGIDLGRNGGELLVEQAGIVLAGEQVVVDLELGHGGFCFLHRQAKPGNLVTQPGRGFGRVGNGQLGTTAHMRIGDSIGDVGGTLRIGGAHEHRDKAGITLLHHCQAAIERIEHGLIDADRRRLAAHQLGNDGHGGKTALRAVELGNRAQVQLVNDLKQRVARLDQLDLAGDHASLIAADRRRGLVGGARIRIGTRLDQDRGRGLVEPWQEHQHHEGQRQQHQRDQQDARQAFHDSAGHRTDIDACVGIS